MSNDNQKKTVKLQRVHLLNYKGISELKNDSINGNHFIVYGKNGQGKTTLTEVINRSALRIDPKQMAELPIKLGAKNANVGMVYEVCENGTKKEILVEITYRPSGAITKLIDLTNEGELKPFQEKLRAIIGDTVDISELLDLKGKEQIEFLKKIGIGVDIAEHEKVIKDAYAERKVLNKQLTIKKAQNVYQSIFKEISNPDFKPLEKPVEPNEEEYTFILKNYNDRIQASELLKQQIADIENQIKSLQLRLSELKEVEALTTIPTEEELQEARNNVEEFNTIVKPAYEEQLRLYNQQQNDIAAYKEYLRKKEEIADIVNNSQQQTAIITTAKNDIAKKIATINITDIVPELKVCYQLAEEDETTQETIEDQIGIYYKDANGNLLPFNKRQISYGRSLVALMKLQSYLNAGKLNLFHIPSWNELDEDSQNEILAFAEQHPEYNIQLCIEEVKNTLLGIRIIEKN